MYTVVLMAALSGATGTPACVGGCYSSCTCAGTVVSYPHGCYGSHSYTPVTYYGCSCSGYSCSGCSGTIVCSGCTGGYSGCCGGIVTSSCTCSGSIGCSGCTCSGGIVTTYPSTAPSAPGITLPPPKQKVNPEKASAPKGDPEKIPPPKTKALESTSAPAPAELAPTTVISTGTPIYITSAPLPVSSYVVRESYAPPHLAPSLQGVPAYTTSITTVSRPTTTFVSTVVR